MESTTPQSCIIAPRQRCISCGEYSGPKFALSHLRGPSSIHRSNEIPTGPQQTLAETNISYAKEEIARIDKEISSLRKSLKALKERRTNLRQFKKQEESLFSPVRKLSEDSLRRIFREVQLNSGAQWAVTSYRDDVVRVITHVSSYWRSIAQSSAFLWSSILVQQSNIHLLKKCIRFSNETPFSFSIGSYRSRGNLGKRIAKSLGRCAHRWNDITLESGKFLMAVLRYIPSSSSFQQLQSLRMGEVRDSLSLESTPVLRKLYISSVKNPNSHITLKSAPLLTDVTLHKVAHPTAMFIGIPWAHITRFEARKIRFMQDEFPRILQSISNLTYLSFEGPTYTTIPIVLPFLESLELHGYISPTNILEIITTPNLRSLQLGFLFRTDNLDEFARRSQFKLDTLKLDSVNIEGSYWYETEFSSVKTFQWDGPPYSIDRALAQLTVADNSGEDLFPQLKNLCMRTIHFGTIDPLQVVEDLITMLESRLPLSQNTNSSTNQYLKSVDIDFEEENLDADDFIDLQTFLRSQEVEQSGVKITITYWPGNNILSLVPRLS